MKFEDGNLILSREKKLNLLEYESRFYQIDYLNESNRRSKGGNSAVFKLIDTNDNSEFAIKFSKYKRSAENIKANNRFDNEVYALYEAQKNNFPNVVDIAFDGIHSIRESGDFNFYVMEKADTDLTNFLKENPITTSQKLVLCHEIIKGINQLHSMKLYHRDIKPDNIFFVGKVWKIGDLGLSTYRGQYPTLDGRNEKIGPYGWLSPEAMNKVLCPGTPYEALHDCIIDHFSDIFQLGKLIWFIFNGNVPIGQIQESDFLPKRKDIFGLIRQMLQYKKTRRGNLDNYQEEFELLIS